MRDDIECAMYRCTVMQHSVIPRNRSNDYGGTVDQRIGSTLGAVRASVCRLAGTKSNGGSFVDVSVAGKTAVTATANCHLDFCSYADG